MSRAATLSTPSPARWLPRPAPVGLPGLLRELVAARRLTRGESAAGLPPEALGGDAPVLLVPGFLAGDQSLDLLAAHLTAAGYRAERSGIPWNVDCGEETMARLERRLVGIAAAAGARVAVVGHSRGGMLARVLARRRPDLVGGVIALAAPWRRPLAIHPLLLAQALALGAAGTLRVPGFVRYSCALGRCCAPFRRDLAQPLPAEVAYVSVYSRRDGIVDWRACVDPAQRRAEVWSTHCGMPSDPITLHLVTQHLHELRRAA